MEPMIDIEKITKPTGLMCWTGNNHQTYWTSHGNVVCQCHSDLARMKDWPGYNPNRRDNF